MVSRTDACGPGNSAILSRRSNAVLQRSAFQGPKSLKVSNDYTWGRFCAVTQTTHFDKSLLRLVHLLLHLGFSGD
jgi:hypothetical protein